MSDTKLKPCPFCGGEAKLITTEFDRKTIAIKVECKSYYARTTGYCATVFNNENVLNNIDNAREKAIEVWNRRVTE